MNTNKFWLVNGGLLTIQVVLGVLTFTYSGWWLLGEIAIALVQIVWNFKNKSSDEKLKGFVLYSTLISSLYVLICSIFVVVNIYDKNNTLLSFSFVTAILFGLVVTSMVNKIIERLKEEFYYGDKMSAWKEVDSIIIVLMVSTIFLSRFNTIWVWIGLIVVVIYLIWTRHKPIM